MIEVDTASGKVPVPHIFKAVNTRSFFDLNDEMRTTRREPSATTESKFMELISYLPEFLRCSLFQLFIKFPLPNLIYKTKDSYHISTKSQIKDVSPAC